MNELTITDQITMIKSILPNHPLLDTADLFPFMMELRMQSYNNNNLIKHKVIDEKWQTGLNISGWDVYLHINQKSIKQALMTHNYHDIDHIIQTAWINLGSSGQSIWHHRAELLDLTWYNFGPKGRRLWDYSGKI